MSNEITAYFKGRTGVSESLYQYDYGMVLNLDGIELPSMFECYFETTESEEAIPAIGSDKRVTIPNDCLSRPGDVTLHIPLHSGENDSEVEYIVRFRVIGRARPVDDGTPEQETAMGQALALLQNPITNIEQIVNEALSFTGDTFDEMQAQLDADQAAFQDDMGDRADAFEAEIRGDIADVESDFDSLNAQFQTAVSALTVDSEVQNIRNGADGVTYTSAGEAVRTQFTNLKSEINYNSTEFSDFSMSVLNEADVPNDFVYGRFLSGGFTETTSYARSKTAYPAGKYEVGPSPKSYVVYEYVSDTEGVEIIGNWTTLVNVFTATRPFYISFANITGDADIATINSDMIVKRLSTESETLEDRVDTNASDIAELENKFESIYSVNRFDGTYTTGGYVNQATGAIDTLSSHSYTPFIDISNHAGRNTIISNTRLANFGYSNLRYAFYKADKTYISGAIAPTLQYDSTLNRDYAVLTTPANAMYIRFSAPNMGFTGVKDWQIQYGSVSEYFPYVGDYDGVSTDVIIENPYTKILSSSTVGVKPSQARADTLSDGESLVVETNSVMKNQRISFFAKIGSAFDKVWVGHGTGSYGYYIIVDGTNFSYASNGSVGTTLAHGLTISEFIGVCVEVDVKLNVKLTITTSGGTYTKTAQINSSWRGDIFAKSDGSEFTDAVLTWESDDYKCPIWAFGDSYFTLYSPTRWPYYVAREWGYNNILLNAYPGEDSSVAYIDFTNAVKHGTPKYILWCLGMNDSDVNSAPNASWLKVIKNVKYICEVKGIELIPATIPLIQAVENTYKNEWIRNNFTRYVDFATAIADVTGWLSDDGVHPSEIGGRFMALKVISDVPELTQGK